MRKKLLGPPPRGVTKTHAVLRKAESGRGQTEQDASHPTHLAHTEEQKVLARQKLEEASVHVTEGAHAESKSEKNSPEEATPFIM